MVKVMEGEGPQIAVSVPLFLKKLWKMVNDKDAEDIIGWNGTGDGFVIYDQLQFITHLLPQYFKHNNMASFIRQLNFYDFHKVASLDKDEVHFTHNCFLKDLPETLVFIKRKCTSVKSKMANNVKEEELDDLLNGVKEIKTKHSIVDNELKLLKQENAALWSEINSLRVKHTKQTKIINKIIHFLISYMHSHQTSLSKRHGAVTRKNNPTNITGGPTILEIDYHNNSTDPKQANQNPYTVTEPGQNGAVTNNENTPTVSNTQPVVDSSLDEILNAVPAKNQQKPSSVEPTIDSSLDELFNIVPSVNQQKAVYNNTGRDSSLGMQKYINTLETPTINLGSKSEIAKDDALETPIFDLLEDSKENLMVNKSENSEGDSFDAPIFNTVSLGNSAVNTANGSKQSLGTQTSNVQNLPVPLKNPANYNILENPKENLGLYLDNTQTELLNLQEMLSNLSSSELNSFLNLIGSPESNSLRESADTDLKNICEVIENEDANDNLNNEEQTEITFPDKYAALPMEADILDETNNDGEGCNFASKNTISPEALVDEYFNTDFQI